MKQAEKLVAKTKKTKKTVTLTYHVAYRNGNKWIIELDDHRGWKGSYYWNITKSRVVKVYKELMALKGEYVPKKVHLEVV